MSMARLWRDQGKRNEARELLAPVYGWFTEVLDTRSTTGRVTAGRPIKTSLTDYVSDSTIGRTDKHDGVIAVLDEKHMRSYL